MEFGSIGKYKRECWSFQKEWRYRINAMPMSFKKMFEQGDHIAETKLGVERILNQEELKFEFIYLKIDDKSFKGLKITLGPGVNDSQRVII